MKCLVLAGGCGDRLWPLSRKNYPKQFMEIRRGCSMFQETVLRNMPYCDEFVIVTNKRYRNIVRAQLRDFQDIKYTVLLEETPVRRAAFIVSTLLYSDKNDDFLITTTDSIIEGDYNACLSRVKEAVKNKKIAVVGIKPNQNVNGGHHYFDCTEGKISFSEKPTKKCYVDCGIMAGDGWTLLQAFDRDFVNACYSVRLENDLFFVDGDADKVSVNLEKVLRTDNFEIVQADFTWTRMVDLSSYHAYTKNASGNNNVISVNNKNAEIINLVNNQLIVANGLKNMIIANTRDALYITPVNRENEIKRFLDEHYGEKNRYFDETPVTYLENGSKEELYREGDCVVSKVTIYANGTVCEKADENTDVNYTIIDGGAKFRINKGAVRACRLNESFTIGGGSDYEISNTERKNLVMMQIVNKRRPLANELPKEEACIVKLRPVFREALWGGTRIRDMLNKSTGHLSRVAESWEMSAHPVGESRVATGRSRGKKFSEFISSEAKEQLGWKTQSYDHFPLLIKFIDANENLSIQVHPDDEFALSQENDYGKNEMWYIMDAAPNAFIYIGFKRNVTQEEILARIRQKTLEEVLNKIYVKKGQTYFLRAGTVHAIGAGCFVCEIQQSSNVTYRLYDYGRIDKNNKPRELHVEKALMVANLNAMQTDPAVSWSELKYSGYRKRLLGQCKYFSVTKYDVDGELTLQATPSSFKAVVILEGSGKIGNGSSFSALVGKGDTWFCGCKETVCLKGKMSFLVATV